jgi:hypothetical protein
MKAGVLQTNDREDVALAPEIAKDCRWVLALRTAADEKPFALLVDGCVLSERHFPWNALLADYRIQAMLEEFGSQLLVAMSPADFAIAWTLGIPAISSARLSDLGGIAINSFCEALAIRRTREFADGGECEKNETSNEPIEGRSPRESILLVFANFSIATLDPRPIPAVAEIVAHFVKLQKFVGLQLDDFGI